MPLDSTKLCMNRRSAHMAPIADALQSIHDRATRAALRNRILADSIGGSRIEHDRVAFLPDSGVGKHRSCCSEIAEERPAVHVQDTRRCIASELRKPSPLLCMKPFQKSSASCASCVQAAIQQRNPYCAGNLGMTSLHVYVSMWYSWH